MTFALVALLVASGANLLGVVTLARTVGLLESAELRWLERSRELERERRRELGNTWIGKSE